MQSPSAWSTSPASPSGGWAEPPRYQARDTAALLWRERGLMAAVFLVIFAMGVAFAFTLKTTYAAHSSLLVRLGQEYVYEPRVGDAARGAVPTNDQVIQSEAEILNSAELRQHVVEQLGAGVVDPSLAADYVGAGPTQRATLAASAAASIGKHLKVESAPDNTVIRLTYTAHDPETATVVLNKIIAVYLAYRKSVLLDGATPATAEQRALFEQRLAAADNALQTFISDNQLGDFDAEKTSLGTLRASLVDENFRVQSRLSEVRGRLGEVKRQVSSVAPEVGLYRDSNAAPNDKLLQLKLDREDLLTRYKPDSQPVREANRKIADLQAMISAGQADSPGPRRTGPNPVFQAVETENLQLAAEAASLRDRGAALTAQIEQVSQQQLKLSALEPRYRELVRQRDVLSDNVKSLASKAEQDQAAQAIAEKSNDNIRIVEPAAADLHGRSLKSAVLALSFVFAAFTAVCAGLLRMFIRAEETMAPATAAPIMASRDLDLPILATAEFKGAHR